MQSVRLKIIDYRRSGVLIYRCPIHCFFLFTQNHEVYLSVLSVIVEQRLGRVIQIVSSPLILVFSKFLISLID